jgi:hypothetical protein
MPSDAEEYTAARAQADGPHRIVTHEAPILLAIAILLGTWLLLAIAS